MYVVFDTETTGLPLNGWSDWSQCHLLQIGWLVVDNNFKVIDSKSFLIRNGGMFKTTPGAFSVHHINDDYREAHGYSFSEVMTQFILDAVSCGNLVCHSANFDCGLIINDAPHYNFDISKLKDLNVYDTKESVLYFGKGMNLSETVHSISPGYTVDLKNKAAHDALYDAYLCLELFRKSPDKEIMKYSFKTIIQNVTK